MSEDRIGEARIERALDPGRVLRICDGDFAALFQAYEEHSRRWELPLDDTTRASMLPGLAALGLHLALQKSDQTVGMTINFASPPHNVFLTGDAGAHTLTGRVFTDDIRTTGSTRLFVQTFRPQTGVSQSSMDVQCEAVLDIFQEYYARSEQFPARFVRLGETRFGMLEALPDGGRERIESMSPDDVREVFAGPRDMVFEHTFRFRCGCNPERIVRALRQIFAGKDEELFRRDSGVEAFCPRCGARWWIERADYAATPPAE